jgi:hypothetical protein
MVFSHFSRSNSLNDVCNGMRLAIGDLNHLGVTKAMRRSSFAYNNQQRSWGYFRRFILVCMISLNQRQRKAESYSLNEKYIFLIRQQ